MNLQEAMDALGIKVTVSPDYDPAREENFPGASHYRVHFYRQAKDSYGVRMTLRELKTQFSTGSAWTREPTGLEVMRSLLWEAASVRYQSFEGWRDELGYDEDSRKALATYEGLEEQTADLARFLYDDSPGEGLDERLVEWLKHTTGKKRTTRHTTSSSTGGKNMSKFKHGQKVTVKSFTATVSNTWDHHTACVQVVDSDGNYHYLFENQIEKPLPFTDGESYVDADGDILIFRATGREGGPGWENPTGHVWVYGYAARPVRTIGIVVEEDN